MSVRVTPYDPRWPVWFEALACVYRRALGGLVVAVEHVGSTSVPGLAAKPILDVDLVIATHAALPEVTTCLVALGYRHEGDLGIPGREAFARDGDDVPRDRETAHWPAHHLYVCAAGTPALEGHLRLRNWLRANPEDADTYARLKQRLAERLRDDPVGYTAGKTACIERMLALAR